MFPMRYFFQSPKGKGNSEKSDATKNALLQLALDSVNANALRQGITAKPTFEFLRNKLLEQLKDSNHRVVERALFDLGYEYVKIEKVEYRISEDAIGIKLSVKDRLIELLDSESVDTRELAAGRLGELGSLKIDVAHTRKQLKLWSKSSRHL